MELPLEKQFHHLPLELLFYCLHFPEKHDTWRIVKNYLENRKKRIEKRMSF